MKLFLIISQLATFQFWITTTLVILSEKEVVEAFSIINMTWATTWNNILKEGGSGRWKVDDLGIKKKALTTILNFVNRSNEKEKSLKILCPLAGDDPFVQYAWSQGHDVTSIDLVPAAVDAMRQQFGGSDEEDWTKVKEENGNVWKHNGGRATLYSGDMMKKRPELVNKFDVVYDKDSFGALPMNIRQSFCKRLSEYTKDDGIIYIEVKNKEFNKDMGPPFHVEMNDLMEEINFGSNFKHISNLGEVYSLQSNAMFQMGHILQRVKRGGEK